MTASNLLILLKPLATSNLKPIHLFMKALLSILSKQNLLALRAQEWARIINASRDLNSDWIASKKIQVGLDDSTWYYDQWITTHGLLKNKICTVPPWSGLWRKQGLQFDPLFDDSDICWHGQGYKDCNQDIHIVPHGCKWFHFFPSQTLQEHIDKFNELTQNAFNVETKDIYH